MKEYFYLDGKEQRGPFYKDQLTGRKLTNETLLWTEGLSDWKKLKEIPDLATLLSHRLVPPPPPVDAQEGASKVELSGEINLKTDSKPSPAVELLTPSRKALSFLICWIGFHLFAVLMSYSEIEIFNRRGKLNSDEFWPFVEFGGTSKYYVEGNSQTHMNWETMTTHTSRLPGKWTEYDYFNGIFVNYDWTEFAFYVGGMLIGYVVYRTAKGSD